MNKIIRALDVIERRRHFVEDTHIDGPFDSAASLELDALLILSEILLDALAARHWRAAA